MKKSALIGTGLLGLLIGVLVFRALNFTSVQVQYPPVAAVTLEESAVLQRFSDIVQLQTVSPARAEDFDPQPFEALHSYLVDAYPLVHQQLSKQVVGAFTLLYHLPGSDPSLTPIMLMAHMDVVPIEESTRDQWVQNPFSGAIQDGQIFGRGTLDNKASMTGILEAMELLLSQGFTPQRGIYLLIGHDEELGGYEGSALVAQQFERRQQRLQFVLDEGLAIAQRLGSFDNPVALIGIAEKGTVSLDVTARALGGHSSQPPAVTSIGLLARAVASLEAHQFPARLSGAVELMFDTLSREMGFGMRMLFANRWLTEPIIVWVLEKNEPLLPMMHTTTALTMLQAGVKSNVMPTVATAVVNFRVLPGDTIEDVTEHARRIIDNPAVEVSIRGRDGIAGNPSPVSDPEAPAYKIVEKTIRQVFPDTVVAPGLVMGGTDSKHFVRVSDNIYRFVPFRINKQNVNSVHGINERIAVKDYLGIVAFYAQLLQNAAG